MVITCVVTLVLREAYYITASLVGLVFTHLSDLRLDNRSLFILSLRRLAGVMYFPFSFSKDVSLFCLTATTFLRLVSHRPKRLFVRRIASKALCVSFQRRYDARLSVK